MGITTLKLLPWYTYEFLVLILLFRSSLQNNFNVDTNFSIFSMRFVSKLIAHSDKKMNSGQQFEEDQYFLISLFLLNLPGINLRK